jgi:SAM-dependent methyltransferase
LRGQTFNIGKALPLGTLDALEVEPCGLLRLRGWAPESPEEVAAALKLIAGGHEVPVSSIYRTRRLDLRGILGLDDLFRGFVAEYLIRRPGVSRVHGVVVEHAGRPIFQLPAPIDVAVPAYDRFFTERHVAHREQIYGSGPPTHDVSGEVLDLARRLKGPVLDFGCGAGALVRELRARGIEAQGLEVDRPEITAALQEPLRPHVRRYAGTFPAPYSDKSFASVTCVEVLEHIPAYREAVAEIARLARETCIFTVPDASAIPLLFPHGVVPWHLLEATHFNFFTQESLSALLKAFFRRVEMARIGPVEVNGSTFFTSLAARCEL